MTDTTMTDTTRIRAVEPEDGDALAELFRQPEVIRGTLQLPFTSTQLWRTRTSESADNFHRLVAEAEGRVVGIVGLEVNPRPRRRHAGSLGISVHDGWQGRGVGTALMAGIIELADLWLGLTRLELTVFTDNTRAVQLYERLGFEIEGTHRAFALQEGAYVDAYAMARLVQPSS